MRRCTRLVKDLTGSIPHTSGTAAGGALAVDFGVNLSCVVAGMTGLVTGHDAPIRTGHTSLCSSCPNGSRAARHLRASRSGVFVLPVPPGALG